MYRALVPVFIALSLVACPFRSALCVGGTADKKGNSAPPDVRTLHFPGGKSLGALILVEQRRANPESLEGYSGDKQVAGALGNVTVTVPPGDLLLFEPNRRVFENPDLLKEVSPDGIDILKLGFISLADQEDQMCERALARVNCLSGLKMLNIDRSEATDAALSGLKNMPHLRCISCFLSSINGACFKDLALLPELTEIGVPLCTIDRENLAYLPHCRKLHILNLMKIHLDKSGAKYLAGCTKLIELSLRGNAQFDDSCMQYLVPLKKLQYLDLGSTSMTVKGLTLLRGLKLKTLVLPWSAEKDLALVRTMFPGVQAGIEKKGKMTTDEMRIYAPLK